MGTIPFPISFLMSLYVNYICNCSFKNVLEFYGERDKCLIFLQTFFHSKNFELQKDFQTDFFSIKYDICLNKNFNYNTSVNLKMSFKIPLVSSTIRLFTFCHWQGYTCQHSNDMRRYYANRETSFVPKKVLALLFDIKKPRKI